MSGASGGHYGVEERGRADGMSSTLVIRDVIASDFGEYNCSVRNSHGEDAFTITLQRKSELLSTIKCNKAFIHATFHQICCISASSMSF